MVISPLSDRYYGNLDSIAWPTRQQQVVMVRLHRHEQTFIHKLSSHIWTTHCYKRKGVTTNNKRFIHTFPYTYCLPARTIYTRAINICTRIIRLCTDSLASGRQGYLIPIITRYITSHVFDPVNRTRAQHVGSFRTRVI